MRRARGVTAVEALIALALFSLLIGFLWALLSMSRRGQTASDRDSARLSAALVQERIESDILRLVAAPGAPPVRLAADGTAIGLWQLADRSAPGKLAAAGVVYRTVAGPRGRAVERVTARSERIGSPHVTGAAFALTPARDALRVTLELGALHSTFTVRLPRLAGDRDRFKPELHTLDPIAPFPVPELRPDDGAAAR